MSFIFSLFGVLICPTWNIVHFLLAAMMLSKVTDVESSFPELTHRQKLFFLTHTVMWKRILSQDCKIKYIQWLIKPSLAAITSK